jgi:hypothetical protein
VSQSWTEKQAADINLLYLSPIRVAIVTFGRVFSEITVPKITQKDGTKIQRETVVPIVFSSQSNYAVWLSDFDSRAPEVKDVPEIRKTFPVMSYDLTGIAMDPSRQTNPLLRHMLTEGKKDTAAWVYNSSYYTFDFRLSIWSKELMSSLVILNKILTNFNPEVTVKVYQEKSVTIIEDCKIILSTVARQDNYLDGFEKNRIIEWDLDFKMNGCFYGTETESQLVTEIQVDMETTGV